ncbi:uncharacterized protein BKA55DRAFT_544404 [Fusarium redolens]|uniref:Uncharacterized protein n=1 Tax=Fusarium redolens TaxID=48865 RepID=A0A9P9G833_FUSRE|nr:uncharacterized protein BKA55DRAFT_544404 [Fusarium redolens]KAH7233933.1 hypothetical protein BKA55DRAFT_544404 [Fusarium redolens]
MGYVRKSSEPNTKVLLYGRLSGRYPRAVLEKNLKKKAKFEIVKKFEDRPNYFVCTETAFKNMDKYKEGNKVSQAVANMTTICKPGWLYDALEGNLDPKEHHIQWPPEKRGNPLEKLRWNKLLHECWVRAEQGINSWQCRAFIIPLLLGVSNEAMAADFSVHLSQCEMPNKSQKYLSTVDLQKRFSNALLASSKSYPRPIIFSSDSICRDLDLPSVAEIKNKDGMDLNGLEIFALLRDHNDIQKNIHSNFDSMILFIFISQVSLHDKAEEALNSLLKKFQDTEMEQGLWILHQLIRNMSMRKIDRLLKWQDIPTEDTEGWWKVRYRNEEAFVISLYNEMEDQEVWTEVKIKDFERFSRLKSKEKIDCYIQDRRSCTALLPTGLRIPLSKHQEDANDKQDDEQSSLGDASDEKRKGKDKS